MEIPLRFRQIALLPTALVFLLLSFPLAVIVHDVILEILAGFTNDDAIFLFTMLATFGALGFWIGEIWLIYKFVSTGGLGILE